ncbi:hypothetical protein CHS0354_005295, partial [Potamilus streckersoni]
MIGTIPNGKITGDFESCMHGRNVGQIIKNRHDEDDQIYKQQRRRGYPKMMFTVRFTKSPPLPRELHTAIQ